MTWKVMPRNVWKHIANLRIERLYSHTKSQHHAWMTIISKKKNWDLLENCQKYALKFSWNKCILARIGRPDIVWSVNKLARAVTKWARACDKRLARLISYIHHTIESGDIVMREILHNNADWDCSKTLTLLEILKTQNRPRVESCASVAVTRLFPEVGGARNRLQSHTVRRNLKLFLLMQVCAWMEFPLLISGIWLLKYCILLPTKHRDPKSKRGSATNNRANTQFVNLP